MRPLRGGPRSRGPLQGSAPTSPPVGPVPAYVTAAPSAHPMMMGAAVFFSIATPLSGINFPAEYTFGTHASALITAEAQKTQQWAPAAGGAPPRLGAYVVSGPAPFDPNVLQPWDPQACARVGSPPQIGAFSTAAPSGDPNVPPAVDPFNSARAATASTVPLAQWAAPRPLDSIQPVLDAPMVGPQGPTVRSYTGAPSDPSPYGLASWSTPVAGPSLAFAYQFAAPPTLDSIAPVVVVARIGPQGSTVRAYGAAPADQPSVPASQLVAPLSAALPVGVLGRFQWAAPTPLDPIQGWIEISAFNPQGTIVPCQKAAPGDLWGLAPQNVRSAAAPFGPLGTVQWAAPTPLDAIQGWVETPTFSAQGFRIAFQSAAPAALDVIAAVTVCAQIGPQGPTVRAFASGPTDPGPAGLAATFTIQRAGSVAGVGRVPAFVATLASPVDPTPSPAQKFASAAGGAVPTVATYQAVGPRPLLDVPQPVGSHAAIGQPLAFAYQIAAPQPLDPIQGNFVAALFNRQGPTIRAFVAEPSDPAPLGLAATFTIERAGSVAGIGPVPAFVVTLASPAEPIPPTPQKFSIAAGGALPSLATYQCVSPRTTPELMAPAWSNAIVGASFALSYQFAAPQPFDSLAPQTSRVAAALAFGRVPLYVSALAQPLDSIAAQIVTTRTAAISAGVPAYVSANAQQIDLTVQAAISRAAAGISGATVRSFASAPAFTDVLTAGAARSTYFAAVGFLAPPAIPTIRFMLSDYPQRIILTEYALRIS
jgi:hypothetical protein